MDRDELHCYRNSYQTAKQITVHSLSPSPPNLELLYRGVNACIHLGSYGGQVHGVGDDSRIARGYVVCHRLSKYTFRVTPMKLTHHQLKL